MNRATAERMNSRTDGVASANAKWETPLEVFEKLQRDFGPFDVDLFADKSNHLLPEWFGPGAFAPGIEDCRDALQVYWHCYGRNGFGNPPYGAFVKRVLQKAKEQCALGFDSTLLLPMRVTKAFQQHVMAGAAQVYLCDKRITFNENGSPRLDAKGHPQPAMFDSMIVRYMHGYHNQRPMFDMWQVPPHGGRS